MPLDLKDPQWCSLLNESLSTLLRDTLSELSILLILHPVLLYRRQIETTQSKLLPSALVQQLPWDKCLVKLQFSTQRYCSHPPRGGFFPLSFHSEVSTLTYPHQHLTLIPGFVSCRLLVHTAF